MTFDGIDDVVVVPEAPEFDFQTGDSFTVEAWIKTSSTQTDMHIVAKHLAGSYNGYSLTMSGTDPTYCNTLGHVSFYVAAFGGEDACSDQPLNDGLWHHIVGVYDHGTNQTRLYVDGVLQGDVGSRLGDLDNSEDLNIGSLAANSLWFDGEIDEVRLWNTARTLPEIQAKSDTVLIGNEAGLVGYYKFDQTDQTITTLPDRSANNNNGVLNGFGGLANWNVSGALGVPNAPSNFVAYATSATEVTFEWVDNATSETGFLIESADDFTFSTNVQIVNGAVAADAVTSTENVGTDVGKLYRITAVNGLENATSISSVEFASTSTFPGYAVNFNAQDNEFDLGDPAELDFGTGNFTIETWYKVDDPNADLARVLLRKDQGAGTGNRQLLLQYDRNTDGNDKSLYFVYFTSGDNGAAIKTPANTIVDGN